MTGKIVTIGNRKGGVGKTTLTIGLADALLDDVNMKDAANASLIVAVDLDPQASLTRALLHEPGNVEHGGRLGTVLKGKHTLAVALDEFLNNKTAQVDVHVTHRVGRTGFPFALLANDAGGWDIERHCLRKAGGEKKLKSTLKSLLLQLKKSYAYVLIDCPPGQTVIAEAALEASDLILCPIAPDYLSFWGLESFDAYLRELFADAGDERPSARYIFTKWRANPPAYDPQNKIAEEVARFAPPQQYVTLLHEVGGRPNVPPRAINMPFDPKLVTRLEGAPRPGRIWPFSKTFTSQTQIALKNLAVAVKQELQRG